MITRRDAALGAMAAGGLAALPGRGAARPPKPFVRVEGPRFVLGGETYRFAGTNIWYGAYLGASGRDRLRRELDTLADLGVTNLRVLGASELSPLKHSLSPAFRGPKPPYNRKLLEGLDILLAEMGKRDMKAVIFLNNFWAWGGAGRAEHKDYLMSPGDTSYVGDPPQEPQGANSVFDSDASTLELIRGHVAALKAING